MGNNALRDADLTLGGNPLYLRDKAPTIHQEYVSDDEIYASYSISPEFSRLLSSPTFTRAVEEKIGAFSIVEIQVEPNREVQVRLPGADRFEAITVSDPRDDAEITRILKKSQEAYNRYRDSLPPTPVTSPSLYPGRVSPTRPSQIPDLSAQLADLQHELRTVKMQRELDNKRHQIQELKRQVRDLQSERADAHAILSEARELFEEEEAPDLVAAIKGLQREVREGRAENADLRAALEGLQRDKQAEVRELQDQLDEANGLFPSSDTRPLPAKILALMEEAERLRPLEADVKQLRAIIEEMQATLPGVEPAELPQALKRLQEAHDVLQEQLQSHKANALHLQGELANLGQQHEVDEERVRGAVAIASDWQKRANEAEEELRGFAEVIHDLRRDLYDTREALKRDRHTLNLVERQNADLQRQAQDASGNLEWIEWGLDIADGTSKPLADRIRVVGEALDAAQQKSEVLELQLETQRLRFEQELREAQEELAQLRPLPEQARQLAATLEGVQHSLQSDSSEDLPGQVARLKQQYDELVLTNGETLDANRRLGQTLEQRVADLEEMTTQKDASDRRVEELTVALRDQKAAFEKQIQDLESQLLRARNENRTQLELLQRIQRGLPVQADIEQLPAEVRDLVERYNALSAKNSGNEDAIEELRSQLVTEERAKQKAQSALDEAHRNNAALGLQLESQRRQFEQALQQAQEELERLRPLPEQARELSAALKGVQRSLQSGSSEDLPGQVATLKQAYDQLVATHGKALVANQELRSALDQQVREYQQLDSQKRESDQTVRELTDQLQAARSSNSKLQDTLRAIQSGLEVDVELEQLPAEVRSLVERNKKLSAEHSVGQEALQELRREAGGLMLSLERETKAKDELQEALDQVKAQLEKPGANIGELAGHVAELQKALQSMTQERDALQLRVGTLEDQLRDERGSNAKQLKILQAIQRGLPVKADIEQLPAQVRDLVERYNALSAENNGNEDAVEELQADLEELRSQLVTEARAKQKAQSALEEARRNNSALGIELESQRRQFEQALQQAQEELERLRPLPEQARELSAALEGVQHSLQSDSSEDLPGQVATLKQAYDQLVATHGKALVANQELRSSLDQQVREYQQLDSQKRESDQTVRELTDQLQAARSSNSKLQDTLRAIQSGLEVDVELEQLPAEVRSLVERNKKLSAEHSVGQEALQELRREAGGLVLSLERETKAKGELQEALEQIKVQLMQPDANIGELADLVGQLQVAKVQAEERADQLEAQIREVRQDASAAVERIQKLKASGEEESGQRHAALLKELEEVRRGAAHLERVLEREGIESEYMRGTLQDAGEENIRMNLELLRLRGILASLEEKLGPSPRLDVQMGQVPEFEHLPGQLQESLEAAQEKFSQAQADIQRYEREISDLNERHAQELAQIKGSVGKAREELDEAYQRDREALEAQVLEARTQFDDRREALRATIASVREELQLMTDSREAYREDNERLEHEVEKLKAIIARQKKEALDTHSEVEERDLIIEDERARAERIQRELNDLKSAMVDLAAERDDLEAHLKDSSEMTTHYQQKSDKLGQRNIELSLEIDRLQEELDAAQARIKKLEVENDRLHAIIARLLGLEYPLPSTSYTAEGWESHIQRNYADMTMNSLLDRAIRTEDVLEEVHGKARIEEAARLELQEELRRRDEEERRRLEMLAQLEEVARVAQQNPIHEIEQREGEDEHEVEVFEALNGLEAIIQGMSQGGTMPALTSLHQSIVNVNKAVLESRDNLEIEAITKRLSGKYASKPPTALLNIFNDDAVKIKEFAAKISDILNQQLTERDTTFPDLIGKTRLQALTSLRKALSVANREVLDFNTRVQEGEDLEQEELARVEQLIENIPFLKQEMSRIAHQFIPELLFACTAPGGGRTYPRILRELRGWIGFFDSLNKDRDGNVYIPTTHATTDPFKVERFRRAITPLNRTLEAFFDMIPKG